MYDKQLDSGRGTLLHLCDDVIQQEVSTKLRVITNCLIRLFNVYYFGSFKSDQFSPIITKNQAETRIRPLERSMIHVLKWSGAVIWFNWAHNRCYKN